MDPSDLRNMTFEEFRDGDKFFDMMQDIAAFRLSVKLPLLGRWQDEESAQRVGFRLYDYLAEALKESEFHSSQDMELITSDSSIKVQYTDPEFGFDVALDNEGLLSISRRGSSLMQFHNWFVKLMPSTQGIVQMLTSATVEEIKRQTGFERQLQVQWGSFMWRVIAYGFTTAVGVPVKNLDLVRKYLPLVPNRDGRLTDDLDPQEHLGRTELNVQRWSDPPAEGRRELYGVSAPSNNAWSSLWFEFGYAGDTYYSPEGTRHAHDPSRFLGPRDLNRPYLEFFRDHALRGFLGSITQDHRFRTTSGVIP